MAAPAFPLSQFPPLPPFVEPICCKNHTPFLYQEETTSLDAKKQCQSDSYQLNPKDLNNDKTHVCLFQFLQMDVADKVMKLFEARFYPSTGSKENENFKITLYFFAGKGSNQPTEEQNFMIMHLYSFPRNQEQEAFIKWLAQFLQRPLSNTAQDCALQFPSASRIMHVRIPASEKVLVFAPQVPANFAVSADDHKE